MVMTNNNVPKLTNKIQPAAEPGIRNIKSFKTETFMDYHNIAIMQQLMYHKCYAKVFI